MNEAERDGLTADEQRRGRGLDERLAEEEADRTSSAPARPVEGELVDEDRPDEEPELVSEMTPADADAPADRIAVETAEASPEESVDAQDAAAEHAAMRVSEEAPGATEDTSDGYGDDEDERR